MPTIQIFINTTRGDIQRAFVKSAAAATVDANPPALVVGNKRDVEIYLVDDAGNFDARSGAVGYSMAFGAGPVGAIPSGGTFTLSDGTNATAAIARNATAAQVQAALNAIDGGAGPFGKQVIVTTGAQGVYTVKFSSTGAVADLIGEASELTPESTVVVNQSIAGSATVKERQFIRLMREPVVYTDTFTPIANGWSGTLSANNARAIELMAGKSIIATDLDVELTASGGVPETIARGQIAIANEVINPLTLDAEELAIALTIAAGDARYLQRSNDLSDLASASAARGNLGLSNVDNTSAASKPVSTAQQAAIDLKADITALTAETDAREAADNRREFKGGVYFDGSVVSRAEITDLKLNEISATNFTLFFKGTVDDVSHSSRYGNLLGRVKGVGSYVVGDFGLGYNKLNGGQVAFISATGSTTIVGTGPVLCPLNTPFEIACTVNPTTGQVVIYKDGAQVLDETLSGMDLSSTAPCLIFGNQSAAAPTIYAHPTGTVSDVAILNTALTSTQASEIYRDGLQPWLAANPEYRQGSEIDLASGYDFTSGWLTAGTTTIDDANSFTSAAAGGINILNIGMVIGNRYRIAIEASTTSSSYSLRGWTDQTIIGTGNGSYEFTAFSTGIYIRNADTGTTDITKLEITQVGALANLPLDDDSRQLKDISGNRNDATASEAGVTHLIQQNTHSFRDDHADGTGGSYLIANSDILAENEVITGVTMDGRFYAATGAQDLTKRRIKLVTSGSHIEVKRSDGTTDDAANVTTHPASTTDFAVNVLTQRI